MGIYRGWIISVTRRINWVAGKRADLSDMRSIESAVSYDFDSLATTILTGESKSYIVRGFELSMSSAIGSPASGLQLLVSNSSFLHGSSAVSGTFFSIPTGTNPELLDSNVNTKVIGSFVTNTVNYIGIEFNRSIDPATSGQTYLWNPATKTEISKTLPLAETLSYNIIITSSSWAANVLPIATVTTNVNNNVISVTDNRPMYMRLGTAGFNTPNPIYSYPWNNQTEGRVENSYISSTNNVSPFRGGDKQILNMKEWMDAIMTSVKEIKGTTYWYQPASVGSLTKLREDTTNTVITGTGNISHDPSVAGKANWSSDVILNFLGGNLKYTIAANPTSSYVTLADNQVAYIKLVRDVVIPNNLIFTNGSNIVTSVDLLANWTSNLVAGDFIKLTVADDTKYYHIASVNTISQVTLTLAYAESTSPTIGDVASYAWGSYQAVATPTTDRHIKIVNKSALPFNQDTYWLFFRCDDASIIPKLYARFTQTELTQGESINISNTTSNQVLEFIGSPSDATSTPTYSLIAAGAITGSANYNTIGGQNLTERSAYLTSMMQNKAQDKTIKYADNYITVNNLTSGSNQLITFIGSGTPTTNVILPSVSNFNNTITLTGTLTLAVNQAAYFVVDRNAGFSVSTLSSLIVTSISSVPLNENTFIFAYRLSAVDCYLYNGKHLNLGGNPMNSAGGLIKARVRNNTSTTLPTGAVVIDGITILDQDTVLFTNLSSGNNEIYTATVVAGSVTTWNAQYDFSGYTTPTIGDLVNISEGTVFGGSITWGIVEDLKRGLRRARRRLSKKIIETELVDKTPKVHHR